MTRVFYLLLVVLCLNLGCGATSSSSDADTGTVTGQLVDSDSDPVVSATVSLYEDSDYDSYGIRANAVAETVTDASGNYTLSAVSEGDYTLYFEYDVSALAQSLSLDALQTLSLSSITLPLPGHITGNAVLDGATNNVGIQVFIPGTSYSAMTDSDGDFVISNIPEGTYDLYYIYRGYVSETLSDVDVDADSGIEVDDVTLDEDPNYDDVVDGEDGDDGDDGAFWFSDSTTPNSSLVEDGDKFFNTDSGNIYEYSSDSGWELMGNILGEEGDDGDDAELEVPGILVSRTILEITEGSGSEVFSMRLTSQPDDDVLIEFGESEVDQITLNKSSLTFTDENYFVSQNVDVSADIDGLTEGEHTVSINFTVTSYDFYNGKSVSDIGVIITDID